MKSALVASLGLATLASANNVYPQHPHFNYRRQNGTAIAGAGELTTLTVQQTSIRTIISCAPTVTNCPANQASLTQLASTAPEQVSTVLVTDVIQLATTICPVTEAQAVSSSVISVAATGGITGTTITGTAPGVIPTMAAPTGGNFPNGTQPTPPITANSPTATGPAGEEGGDDEDECEPDVTTEVSTSVATLTSGIPVTVTVTNGNGGAEESTSTSFTTIVTAIPVTKTVVVTESSPESTGESSPVEGGSGSGEGSDEGTTISGTTTTTAYTTGTRTATLTSKVTKPTGDSSPVDTNSNSSGSGTGEGSDAEGSCVP